MWAPPIQVLKKSNSFRRTDKTKKAVDDLRVLISKPLALASPEPGETLLMYVVTTTQVIRTALVVEQEERRHVYKVQWPGYYISKVLSDCEGCYNQIQKLLYAILITKHKLLHYFESHPIYVVTSFGFGEMIMNSLTTGRITNWALKLMGLDITYMPHMTIKSQALVDFVVHWTETQQPLPRSLKSTGACILMALSPSTVPGEVWC
jgi:hypothetical protein